MSAYEVIPCVECGEQTIAARPTCRLCEADKDMFEHFAQQAALTRSYDPNRGAKQLIGKTIARVDASCVNEIKLIGDDGVEYTFYAEAGPLGIPTVFVNKFPK